MSDSCPTPSLRPYQAQVIEDLYAKVRDGYRRIVIMAGTGSGKTVISGQICAHADRWNSRLLFLVHLDVLVGQTHAKMQEFGLHCGFIKAGWPEDPHAPIQIASVQTMAKRDWWQTWPADVVFYDEGHTTVFSQVGQKILQETHPEAVHIAMTATPYRLGKAQLGDYFETFVAAPVPTELQRLGFLAPMDYYGLPLGNGLHVDSLKIIDGDYDPKGLKNLCDRPELITRIIDEWQRLVPGKRTIAFCVDIEHAHHLAQAFQAQGIPAATVAGGTPPKQRKRLYESLASGQLLVLTSCNVISIGFDVPAVEVGLLLRPTLSLALHYQQIGRVMRISPTTGKTKGMILDQAGNLQRLGFPEDVQAYHLPHSHDQPGATTQNDRPQGKTCPQCQYMVPLVQMRCPNCGHDWARDRPLYTQDLIQMMSRDQLRQIEDIPTRYRVFQVIRQRTFHQGYAPDFAYQDYFDCFQDWPPEDWCRYAIFGDRPTPRDYMDYYHYLGSVAQRLGKSFQWMIQEFAKEFGPDVPIPDPHHFS